MTSDPDSILIHLAVPSLPRIIEAPDSELDYLASLLMSARQHQASLGRYIGAIENRLLRDRRQLE
jgi:hypothetical protein